MTLVSYIKESNSEYILPLDRSENVLEIKSDSQPGMKRDQNKYNVLILPKMDISVWTSDSLNEGLPIKMTREKF